MTGAHFPRPLLYVGHLAAGQTSLMRADAMEVLGVPLVRFDARRYLAARSFGERWFGRLLGRSPKVDIMNRDLTRLIAEHRPVAVWCDKQEEIAPATIAAMKDAGAAIVFYTPDPYFAQPWLQTARSNALLAASDLAVTTKSWEVDEYRRHGDVTYMPHGFCEAAHRPVLVPKEARVELGFVGSWEPRRERFMDRATRCGLSVRIWGYGWDHLITGKAGLRTRARLKRMANGESFSIACNVALSDRIEARQVLGDDYAAAVSASAISPGLLRTTLYPDQHTTRTFEIPACGSMLLAERTPEHEAFFEEDREAVFFEGEDELVDKAIFYAKHPEHRRAVAAAGRERCFASGYSYTERLRPVMAEVANCVAARVA